MSKVNVMCPQCGGSGVTKRGFDIVSCSRCSAVLSYSDNGNLENIHVSGSDHKEVEAVASSLSGAKQDTDKLKLAELEAEYELAKVGLHKGIFAALVAIFAGLISFGGALYAFIEKGPGFMSGQELVILFGLMIFGLVIYFSFVFGRAAKLRLEISETKKSLEMSSGENVRK